jgi:hypothetical protein
MTAIEQFIEQPTAFIANEGMCQKAEGLWGMGLFTAMKESHTIHYETVTILHPHNTVSTGVAIRKPYWEQPYYKFGDATWLTITGPCAGFILTPINHRSLRPLRHIPIDNDSLENRFRLIELKYDLIEEKILTEGPGWYLSAIIELLRKTISIPIDADTIWQNSLEFQWLETDWPKHIQQELECAGD